MEANSRANQNLSDSDLVTKLHDCTELEKEEIFLTFYERYKLLMLKICFHYLGDSERAKDAFHDVFVKVIEEAEKLNNPAVFKSWLLTITRNLCIDQLRKKSFRNHEPLTTEIEFPTDNHIEKRYLAEIEKDKILDHLSGCICKLDTPVRSILKLRWQGLKASEISKMMRLDRKQVRSAYRKIKLVLEASMKQKGMNITIDQIINLVQVH